MTRPKVDILKLAHRAGPLAAALNPPDRQANEAITRRATKGGPTIRVEGTTGVLPKERTELSAGQSLEATGQTARDAWAGGNVTADAIFKNATIQGRDSADVRRWQLYQQGAFEYYDETGQVRGHFGGFFAFYDATGQQRVSFVEDLFRIFDATGFRRIAFYGTSGAIESYDATATIRAHLGNTGVFVYDGTRERGRITPSQLSLYNAAGATTVYLPSSETDTPRFAATPTVGPLGSNVPVALAPLFAAQAADYTGANAAGAQKVFNVSANGAVAVDAATAYLLDAVYHIHTTGTASHALQLAFGGTATLTSMGLEVHVTNTATEVQGADTAGWLTSRALTAVTPATATATHHTVRLRGIVRVNAAGTLIPQYGWSAAPGVAGVTLANSYLTLTDLGANTVTTAGTWT